MVSTVNFQQLKRKLSVLVVRGNYVFQPTSSKAGASKAGTAKQGGGYRSRPVRILSFFYNIVWVLPLKSGCKKSKFNIYTSL